jgi:cytochrome c-type biogenesis protein CcmE
MHLWEEATKTTIYVQNRLCHSALGFKTPEKMFSGKKPEVNHLKIFGCPEFVHILKEKRTKLEHVFHDNSKHIEIRYHYIRDMV